MTKKKEGPRNAVERLEHHEKILALLIDRINENVDPELKMLAGAIQQNKEDIAGIVEWIDRGPFGRTWDRIREVFRGDAPPESTDSDAE